MKVTAYIRKTAAKNDVTTQARVFFRVRDTRAGVDIRQRSELTISPNHWSGKRQGYKSQVSLVSAERRNAFDKAIADIIKMINDNYYIGADCEWLRKVIFSYHHPKALKIADNEFVNVRLTSWGLRYLKAKNKDKHSACNVEGVIRKVERFEIYRQKILRRENFECCIDTMTADDIREFQNYLVDEHKYIAAYPRLFPMRKGRRNVGHKRSLNTLINDLSTLRSIFRWCIREGVTKNNPFERFEMPSSLFGTPFYLTLAERDRLYEHDFSADPELEQYRDMFVFQCLVGCRHSDLIRLTRDNFIDGYLEYVPRKTKEHSGATVRVPLAEKAKAILDRLPTVADGEPIFSLRFNHKFNAAIRKMIQMAGINRRVSVLNPQTRTEEQKPIYEVASSHMARRTFIGNLYKQVKDPNLIGSMSGHTEGSRAFARYRQIDDDMKRDLIGLID